MTYHEWVSIGEQAGWCGPLTCMSHDQVATDEEVDAFYDGDDPCIFVLRIDTDKASQ